VRRIPVDLLSAGLKTARPIYDGQGRVLLNQGVVLTERYISRLKQFGIPAVYIDDGFGPGFEIEDVISEETRTWAVNQVKQLFSPARLGEGQKPVVTLAEAAKVVERLVEEILANKSTVVNLTDIRAYDEYTFGHSVNVAVLAILTGINLGYSRVRLFHLGMAALLHDVGKTRIPVNVLNKPQALTDEEFTLIKKHPVYGYEIINDDPGLGKLCALVALQHHERYNGEGYPQGLSGKEIHHFAGIAGMVDMYDALTSDRIYRKAYPPYEAYEMISGAGNTLFDYQLIGAFLDNVAAYPAGTLVKLNTGEIGVVVETRKGFSLSPRVRILFAASGEPSLEQEEVSLAGQERLFISKVIEDHRMLPGIAARRESGAD